MDPRASSNCRDLQGAETHRMSSTFGSSVNASPTGSVHTILAAWCSRDTPVGRRWPRGRLWATRTWPASCSQARTAAGVMLAASFGLLALVPLRPFRELGFAMALGVLLDVIVVRTLMLPTFLRVVGRISRWPGRSLPRHRTVHVRPADGWPLWRSIRAEGQANRHADRSCRGLSSAPGDSRAVD